LTHDGELAALLKVFAWTDTHLANINLPTDERSLIGQGCLEWNVDRPNRRGCRLYAWPPHQGSSRM